METALINALQDELRQLEAELDELENRKREVNHKIISTKERFVEMQYGVRVGSIVTDDMGREYRVTHIDWRSFTIKPWLRGNPRRKDGCFGTVIWHLYGNWG